MARPFETHDYTPRVKKVKHVKFFSQHCAYDDTINTKELEYSINTFADENPTFKILGVRIESFKNSVIAIITYLEDAKSGFTGEEDYYGPDEERDLD